MTTTTSPASTRPRRDEHADDGSGHRRAQLGYAASAAALGRGAASARLARRSMRTKRRAPSRYTQIDAVAVDARRTRVGTTPSSSRSAASRSAAHRCRLVARGDRADAHVSPCTATRHTVAGSPGASRRPSTSRRRRRRARTARRRGVVSVCAGLGDVGASGMNGSMRPVSRTPARTSGAASSGAGRRCWCRRRAARVGERRVEPVERLARSGGERDHLGEHRVVVGGDLPARRGPRVDPHAARSGGPPREHRCRSTGGSRVRVLGVDARLDRVPLEPHVAAAANPAARPRRCGAAARPGRRRSRARSRGARPGAACSSR